MTLLAIPDLCDPDRVRVAWIPGDDITQTAGHLVAARKQNLDQPLTLSWDRIQLANQSIQFFLSILQEILLLIHQEEGNIIKRGHIFDKSR